MTQMPPPVPSEPPTIAPHIAPRPSNPLGVAAFVCSIVGLVAALLGMCCFPIAFLGVLCLAGAIMGLIAMRTEPRGFAVAGLVTGIIGVVVTVLMIAVVGAVFGLGMAIVKKTTDTHAAIRQAAIIVDEAVDADGTTPTDEAGRDLIDGLVDGWSHPLEYQRISETDFEIISSGFDEKMDTPDDITLTDVRALTGGP